MKLVTLGISNAKTAKTPAGSTVPVVNDILHLAPANATALWAEHRWNDLLAYAEKHGLRSTFEAFGRERAMGIDTCASASPGCRAACLNTAGHGRFDNAQIARVARTLWFYADRGAFMAKLNRELTLRHKAATKAGAKYVFRPNGTSDLPGLAMTLASAHPEIQFYDYTAHPKAWARKLPNYHLTFSRKETNDRDCIIALSQGVNVTVVFNVKKGAPLPASYMGKPVIDGDVHDFRYLDPVGVVVGLRPKGLPALRKAAVDSGFAVSCSL